MPFERKCRMDSRDNSPETFQRNFLSGNRSSNSHSNYHDRMTLQSIPKESLQYPPLPPPFRHHVFDGDYAADNLPPLLHMRWHRTGWNEDHRYSRFYTDPPRRNTPSRLVQPSILPEGHIHITSPHEFHQNYINPGNGRRTIWSYDHPGSEGSSQSFISTASSSSDQDAEVQAEHSSPTQPESTSDLIYFNTNGQPIHRITTTSNQRPEYHSTNQLPTQHQPSVERVLRLRSRSRDS